MQLDRQLLLILAAVGSILTLASVAVYTARMHVRSGAAALIVDDAGARVRGWWGMVVILGAAALAGRAALVVLFALISFLTMREFFTISELGASDRHAMLAMFLAALPAHYLLLYLGRGGLDTTAVIMAAPILIAVSGDTRRLLARTAELMWGWVLCVYCISFAPALLNARMPGRERGHILLIAFLVLIAEGSDVLQYLCGKLVGRHGIAPVLSPSKTVEGFAGGVIGATALGVALSWMTPFGRMEAAAIAFVVAVTGFFGGLVLSGVKRDRGVKDWGDLIPGHGGVLDRVDSLCFSAPVFYWIVRWLPVQ